MSTVSREVARHGGRSVYRANQADGEAWESALRPKRCLLSINVKVQKMVASKLILDWSPEQISRLAENPVSRGREPARVPRDHLSQPIHSSARSAEERADGAPAIQAPHTPLAALSYL
jgi:IS30 family transposase